jgi:hypothetical protein
MLQNDNTYQEQYLVAIYEILTEVTYYLLISNNKDFAILMGNLNSDKYIVLVVTPLTNVIEFDGFLSKIIKENKSGDMNFGNKG